MTAPVFLDSGIFVAFLNRRDRWHPQARALFDGPKPKWSTSLLVVSEAYSWFLHRMGEESARNLRLLVDALPGLRVFEATAEHHKATTRAARPLPWLEADLCRCFQPCLDRAAQDRPRLGNRPPSRAHGPRGLPSTVVVSSRDF